MTRFRWIRVIDSRICRNSILKSSKYYNVKISRERKNEKRKRKRKIEKTEIERDVIREMLEKLD
jgi:hypothetical protein